MSQARAWAIVPVKSLADAKQRLAAVLPPEARRRLMLVMLEDVLATLRQVEGLGPILVVTPDPEVADVAQSHVAHVLREPRGAGHSAAVITGFTEARANGADQALTLPADAPLVTPDELRALLAARPPSPRLPSGRPHGRPTCSEPEGRRHAEGVLSARREGRGEGQLRVPSVALVPARDGDGTNGVLASPPDAFTPSFGSGSFARHLAQTATAGIACRTLSLPGLGLDIDEPTDLHELMRHTHANPRYAFLARYALLPAGADQR